MWIHTMEDHGGVISDDVNDDYKFKVTKQFKEPTSRITDECIRIARKEC
jgi:hypothetical protein